MSGGPQRYQHSPSYYRTSSRTPELYSFNSGDISSCSNESQAKLVELTNEKLELKESLEFSECERQVLIDTAQELKDTLQKERSQWKKEQDELRKHVTDLIAARVKAESQLTRNDVEMIDVQLQVKKLQDDVSSRDRHIESLQKNIETLQNENKELSATNIMLKNMIADKLDFNRLVISSQQNETSG